MDVFPPETGGFPLLCHYVGLQEGLQPSGSMTIEVLFSLFFFGNAMLLNWKVVDSYYINHEQLSFVSFRTQCYQVKR